MVNFRYVMVMLGFALLTISADGQDKYWYKEFSGTIDKYPFILHLHRVGPLYTGYYYYKNNQLPFSIYGEDSTSGGVEIRLSAVAPLGQEDWEVFKLGRQGDSLNGTWQKNKEAVALAVKAREEADIPLQFGLIYSSGSQKLRPKYADSPVADFSASSVWPKGSSAAIPGIKKVINKNFGLKNSQADIGKTLIANKKSFFSGYIEDHRTMKDSELLGQLHYNYSEEDRLAVMYRSSNLLSLSSYHYLYSGGAHGNYATLYSVVDLKSGKVITLADVLSTDGQRKLNSLLEQNFRKSLKIPKDTSIREAGLFSDKIEQNGNFFLTGTGIGFGYSPYEIGPYVMGEILIFIPYSDFGKNGLNPGFHK